MHAREALVIGVLLCALQALPQCAGGSATASEAHRVRAESRLLNRLLVSYDRRVRPSATTEVDFGISLNNVINVEERPGEALVTVLMWHNYQWNDWRLEWDEQDEGVGSSLRLDPRNLWLPDIRAYNGLNIDADRFMRGVSAVVYSSGMVSLVPPTEERVLCSPGDDTTGSDWDCSLKYGSWTHDGGQLNLTSRSDRMDAFTYSDVSWELVYDRVERNLQRYECCPEPYIDITAHWGLKHKQANA